MLKPYRMTKNIRTVLTAWWAGQPCKQMTCETDGWTVFSYGVPIAQRRAGMCCVTVRTTSPKHVTRNHILAVRLFIQEQNSHLVERATLTPTSDNCERA